MGPTKHDSRMTSTVVARKQAHLCEEIEWQLACGQGWFQAMNAVGYTSQASIYRQLIRAGRPDLAAPFNPDRTP